VAHVANVTTKCDYNNALYWLPNHGCRIYGINSPCVPTNFEAHCRGNTTPFAGFVPIPAVIITTVFPW